MAINSYGLAARPTCAARLSTRLHRLPNRASFFALMRNASLRWNSNAPAFSLLQRLSDWQAEPAKPAPTAGWRAFGGDAQGAIRNGADKALAQQIRPSAIDLDG
jgi:hypothetical protein